MFVLHRRKAWQGGQIEASAWDFDLDDLTYRGTVVLPPHENSVSFDLTQFVDDGYGFIYWCTFSVCKVPLAVPYDILSADLTVIPGNWGSTDYASGSITDPLCAQFSPDGRAIYFYNPSYSGSHFRILRLDVPFYPFDKTGTDLIAPTPSLNVSISAHVEFSPNGLNFFVCPVNGSSAEIHHFTLSEPFDVATMSRASRSISLQQVPRDDTNAYGFGRFSFSPDGLRLITGGANYYNGTNSGRLRMWSLRSPWDISTISHLKTVALPEQQTPRINRLFIDPSASFLYCDVGGGRLTQYALSA